MLDTVADPGETNWPVKGQLIRKERELLQIFDQAGLQVHSSSALTSLHEDYRPVRIWALHEKQAPAAVPVAD